MAGLPFIEGVAPERPALLDDAGDGWLSYGELSELSQDWAVRMAGPRGLMFLYARNDGSSVAAMIGALAAGHAVALFDPNLSESARAQLEGSLLPCLGCWGLGRGCWRTQGARVGCILSSPCSSPLPVRRVAPSWCG